MLLSLEPLPIVMEVLPVQLILYAQEVVQLHGKYKFFIDYQPVTALSVIIHFSFKISFTKLFL